MTAMYATCFIQYHCFWKQLEYTLLATCLFYFHLSVNIFNFDSFTKYDHSNKILLIYNRYMHGSEVRVFQGI